ncbi:MAG: ABC transporter, ATP-binding protein [candidate division TM6 bacterium GW2011_GWF2_38_10]|nr:MAG: ABC transporter, ATP-binding protein [candidate division TM6 bacterium GW2011_GWF2_38_10]
MSFLSVKNVTLTLGKKQILNDMSIDVPYGKTVVLLGPNGAGKTTLLKSIIGVHRNPSPCLSSEKNLFYLDNQLINHKSIHERVAMGLVYMPQQTSLFQHMNVLENLKLVFDYHPYWHNQPWSTFKTAMHKWLEQTTLTHALTQAAHSLSGGQKRKLEVVRALLMQPKGIILDEPFAGVDPKSIYELKKIFAEILTTGISIVISDHHVDQLLSMAQHVYVILNGHVACSGNIKDVLENTVTKNTYLGNQFYEEMAQRFL